MGCSQTNIFVLYVTFVLFYLSTVFSSNTCKYSSCCYQYSNGSIVDLSSIGRTDSTPLFYYVFFNIAPENKNILVSYNPCYSFTDKVFPPVEHERKCQNAAGCVLELGGNDGALPKSFAVGLQSTAYSILVNETVKINYNVSDGRSNLTVNLNCDLSKNHTLTVNSVKEFHYEVTLSSRCACADVCKSSITPDNSATHGLSTGSALLITFFVILTVYFAGGILWNFCNGGHGMELLPNSAFWSELPQLIVDGFLFTCNCFNRRSQSTYNDM